MASSLITSWQIDGETMESVRNFIFLGSKITADSDTHLENCLQKYIRACPQKITLQDVSNQACKEGEIDLKLGGI